MEEDTVYIGWTTTETREQAESIAQALIHQRLAACVQVEGPVHSFYRWKAELDSAGEYRLMIKMPGNRVAQVEGWLQVNHPYDNPEWVVVRADHIIADYAEWVAESCRRL